MSAAAKILSDAYNELEDRNYTTHRGARAERAVEYAVEHGFEAEQKKFRAVYMPQVPHEAITVEADTLLLAAIALECLVQLSIFEFENKIKPDYSDMATIEQRDSEGEWEDVDEDDWPDLTGIITVGTYE